MAMVAVKVIDVPVAAPKGADVASVVVVESAMTDWLRAGDDTDPVKLVGPVDAV